jgi:hypothetical protein
MGLGLCSTRWHGSLRKANTLNRLGQRYGIGLILQLYIKNIPQSLWLRYLQIALSILAKLQPSGYKHDHGQGRFGRNTVSNRYLHGLVTVIAAVGATEQPEQPGAGESMPTCSRVNGSNEERESPSDRASTPPWCPALMRGGEDDG